MLIRPAKILFDTDTHSIATQHRYIPAKQLGYEKIHLEKGKEELITNTRSLGKREQTRFWWEKHENPNISPL